MIYSHILLHLLFKYSDFGIFLNFSWHLRQEARKINLFTLPRVLKYHSPPLHARTLRNIIVRYGSQNNTFVARWILCARGRAVPRIRIYICTYVFTCSAFILIECALSPRRDDPCNTMGRSDVYNVTAARDAREEQADAILVTEIYSSSRVPHL